MKGTRPFFNASFNFIYFFWCSRLVFSASPVKKKKKKVTIWEYCSLLIVSGFTTGAFSHSLIWD